MATKRTGKVMAGLLIGGMLTTVPAGAASAFGPQPLPDKACNQGTQSTWTGYYDNVIPHWKDWDNDGVRACYHLNPNYPPGDSSIE